MSLEGVRERVRRQAGLGQPHDEVLLHRAWGPQARLGNTRRGVERCHTPASADPNHSVPVSKRDDEPTRKRARLSI